LITFSLSAVLPNVRHMPARLIEAMPMLVLGLAGLAWIIWRWIRLRRAGAERAAAARRDVAVGLALAASWFSLWVLYAAYTWTTTFHLPGEFFVVDDVRFYVDPIGPIALLAAWLVTRVPRGALLALLTSAAVVAAMFGLGIWFQLPGSPPSPGYLRSRRCGIVRAALRSSKDLRAICFWQRGSSRCPVRRVRRTRRRAAGARRVRVCSW
jgi:hypothetical protein